MHFVQDPWGPTMIALVGEQSCHQYCSAEEAAVAYAVVPCYEVVLEP
jgi:hypothetical protein